MVWEATKREGFGVFKAMCRLVEGQGTIGEVFARGLRYVVGKGAGFYFGRIYG